MTSRAVAQAALALLLVLAGASGASAASCPSFLKSDANFTLWLNTSDCRVSGPTATVATGRTSCEACALTCSMAISVYSPEEYNACGTDAEVSTQFKTLALAYSASSAACRSRCMDQGTASCPWFLHNLTALTLWQSKNVCLNNTALADLAGSCDYCTTPCGVAMRRESEAVYEQCALALGNTSSLGVLSSGLERLANFCQSTCKFPSLEGSGSGTNDASAAAALPLLGVFVATVAAAPLLLL